MLQIKPNCECCNKSLPPASTEAMICSYECTFCYDCVTTILENVCPNCGGGFSARPIRPSKAWRDGVGLAHHPASDCAVSSPYSTAEIQAFSATIKHLKPTKR